MHHIPPKLLLLDKPLPWDVFDSSGALLLCKGYQLTRESQRDVLLAHGLYVDESLIGSSIYKLPPEPPKTTDPFRLWDSIISELGALLRNMRLEVDFRAQIKGLTKLIHDLSLRNPDTALAAIILSGQKQYPIIHSIHVAVMCELVAQRLGWESDRRESLVCAALTMNLAMLDVQQTLCTQRMAPSPVQRQEIHRHPQFAVDLLVEVGIEDKVWLQAVAEHHERLGGGGYPFGITHPSEEALLIQTVDIFTAKVSPRAARKPVSPQEAARTLYIQSGGGRSNPFVTVLIKEIGIFPPGTFVLLSNGDKALVTRRGEAANTPQVLSLVNATGGAYPTPAVRNTAHKPFDIVAVIPRDQINVQIDTERIWRAV
ncbi:HD-GYP domain-containing protein [Uliginosibacterium gangwonense]|uniref:HD-GYP domain-containing protein n=1 Tax=Uliginosibacterium gangwonense TaxID=392736 RepID=UPI00038103BE|nr:HD domain-containing phosphohydrolase [Uliginosibacterium gangwonense]